MATVEGVAAVQTAVSVIATATGTATETGTVSATETETGIVTATRGLTGTGRTGRGTIAGAAAGAAGGGAVAAGAGKVVAETETATGVEAVVDAAEAGEGAVPFRQSLCPTGLEASQMAMDVQGPCQQTSVLETGCAQSATSTTTGLRRCVHSVPPRCPLEGAHNHLEATRRVRRVAAKREEASGMMTAGLGPRASSQRKCPSGSKIWCQRRQKRPGLHQALIQRTSR